MSGRARPASSRGYEARANATATIPAVPAVRRAPGKPAEKKREQIVPRRLYWTVLVCWTILLQTWLYNNSGSSWHYFADGAALLQGQHPPGETAPGGLHLYANYPELQIGPLALSVAVALGFFSPYGWFLVTWFMTLCGRGALYFVEHVARAVRPDTASTRSTAVTMLVGGGSFLLSWELLAVHFGHLDDVLALLLLAAAMVCVVYGSPMLTGVCVGLAADAKPWALACAALLLIAPRRDWWRGAAGLLLMILLAWLPFVLADPHTLGVGSFTIPNVPASGLHALGVNTPATPSWDRAAQLGLGCALGVVAVWRRRWAAIIGLGLGARIALDPSVYTYYTAGLALGLLVWDLIGYRRPVPVLSLVNTFGITLAVYVLHNDHILGYLRLAVVFVATMVMLAVPRKSVATEEEFLDYQVTGNSVTP